VKLLEIGTGCGKQLKGTSYELWNRYFNQEVDMYFIERDCSCAEKFVLIRGKPNITRC